MTKRKTSENFKIKFIFFISILYTISIIALTFSITYYLDQVKVRELLYDYKYEILTINEYDLFIQYLDGYFENNRSYYCNNAHLLLDVMANKVRQIGVKLSKYGESSSSLSEVDYDYLKRKFYLSMLKEYDILWEIKKRCNNVNVGLFFFKRDQKDSLIMGRVYEEFAKRYNNTYILSFDVDYKDISLLNYIKHIHNISDKDAPVLVLNDKCIIRGVMSIDDLIKYIKENKCI